MRTSERRRARGTRTIAAVIAGLLCAVALSACGPFPTDTEGTLDRVRGGDLRVGVVHNPPWTDTSGAQPRGSEVTLVERFAAEQGAGISWREDSEAVLADALRAGELDIAIGGFTADTPWSDRAAVTDTYLESVTDDGVTEQHVMLTRAGENRFLVTLEEFLRGGAP